MGRGEFVSLMAHLRWADECAWQSLARVADPPTRTVELYAHIIGTEETWLARITGNPARMAVWPDWPLERVHEMSALVHRELGVLAESVEADGGSRAVDYVNSAGQAFRSRVADMLRHVAQHGSYHRGQIALLLRGDGLVPEPTDYIAFVRGAPAATRSPCD
jgi:uncharacterized damage-inducible protein DinB